MTPDSAIHSPVDNASTTSVGSLTYDKRQLITLYAWLLLRDFAMVLIDTALPRLLPLHLSKMGVSPGLIGTMLSLGPLASLVLSPLVGVRSDRMRSRFGRRRPFLWASTPCLGLGVILLPHVQNLLLLGAVVFVVQIGVVLQTVVYYLYSDVVPPGLMGRFMAAFRIVSLLGAIAFQSLVLPHFDRSPAMVWGIVELIYIVLFQLMLWNVREGTYPAPEPRTGTQLVSSYVRDGAGSVYIWMFWGALCMAAITLPCGPFYDLFMRVDLKISLSDMGAISAWALVPGGWLIDRIGPQKLWGWTLFITGMLQIPAYYLIHDRTTVAVYFIGNSALAAFTGVALMPMLYRHLPKEKFGQLVSMQSFMVQGCSFVSANLLGRLIEAFDNDYRPVLLYGILPLMCTPLFIWGLSRARNPFKDLEKLPANDAPLAIDGNLEGRHASPEASEESALLHTN